jgi:hypothetical protein
MLAGITVRELRRTHDRQALIPELSPKLTNWLNVTGPAPITPVSLYARTVPGVTR